MLRTVPEREGHLAACVLNAPDAEGGDSDRCVVGATCFRLVCHATSAVRLDDQSLDSTNMYVAAGTQLKPCVLDRIGPPNRQARPLLPASALHAFLASLPPAQNMLRRQVPKPLQRRPHSTECNIFLSAP
jgi:hypothetical protein